MELAKRHFLIASLVIIGLKMAKSFSKDKKINQFLPNEIASMGVSRTYQNIRLFANLTALENILIGRHSHQNANLADVLLSK